MIALRAGLTTALVLFGATGCSEPIDDPSQNPPLKELGCNPGERLLEDESCRSAGVPAEGCGSGFVADGQGGCDPILPLMDCPAGEIAVPGDSTCREIMACGSGTYGDIPVDATTHYVDDSYGGMSDGSASQPWTTIQEALAAAPPGTLVAVAAGSYGGSLDITKPVRLWGRCPAQVEVVGTDQEAALVTGAGSGSELRGVSLRGSSVGVFVNGATGVLLDSVRIHDVTLRGVNVQSAGPSLTLRGSVVEDAGQVSVVVLGGDALIEGTMMRTRPGGPATGQGLAVQKGDAGSSAIVRVERVLIDGTGTCGMRVSGASLDVEGTVVRRGRPGQDGSFGSGVLASPEFDGTRAQLTVRRSVIEDNHHWSAEITSPHA